MSLAIHLFLHLIFAIAAGFFTWLFFDHAVLSFVAAFFGGVLIDLDHIIDYVIAFGMKFRPVPFLKGYQFIKNDKIYVLFHGWEYVILSIISIWLMEASVEVKTIVCGLTSGVLFHLIIDRYINPGMSYKAYSLFYRAWNRFEIKDIVTDEHYRIHQKLKKVTRIK